MMDELIKRLRCQRFGNCPNCPMWYTEEVEPNLWRERCAAIDAADAIESLEKENRFLKMMQQQMVDKIPMDDIGRMAYATLKRVKA